MDKDEKHLKELASLLRANRPEPTPLELDEVKRRVIDRHGRKASSAWTSWRARLALASIFVLAFAVNAFGVPGGNSVLGTALNGTSNGNSGTDEYCPKDNPNHQQCQPRMTGGGTGTATIPAGGVDVHHGFELRCDVNNPPNRLEVNWGPGESFHLETLTSVMCLDDPNTAAPPPGANWDTYYGTGVGRLKGHEEATAEWCFQDGGEPGGNGVDTFTLKITDSGGNVVLFFVFSDNQGNEQAHGFTPTPSPGTCPAITPPAAPAPAAKKSNGNGNSTSSTTTTTTPTTNSNGNGNSNKKK